MTIKETIGKYICKISKIEYKNCGDHKIKCIYKYCKKDWNWS